MFGEKRAELANKMTRQHCEHEKQLLDKRRLDFNFEIFEKIIYYTDPTEEVDTSNR